MKLIRSAPLTGGGTVSGDLTVEGDLVVEGGGSLSLDHSVTGVLGLADSDVAHGMTGLAPTDTYVSISALHATNGGVLIRGMSDNEDGIGMQLYGTIGNSNPSDAVPAIELRGSKKDGTGHQAVHATETVFQIGNLSTDLFTVMGSGDVGIGTISPAVQLDIESATTSSATEGGRLRLGSNDGAVMASGHRLGVLEFAGAEDGAGTMTVGARIEAVTDALWSASENGADMVFYTTDGNAVQSESHRILATGHIQMVNSKGVYWGDTTTGINGSESSNTVEIATSNAVRLKLDNNSKISLSNNDSGGTSGTDSTSGNTLFGYLAGEDIASGGLNNTFIGHGAGKNVTTGDTSVMIGVSAGDATLDSNSHVLIGGGAGGNGDIANDGAVAVGYAALHALTTGSGNIAIGWEAMDATDDGNNNIAIGGNDASDNGAALGTNTEGSAMIAIGTGALFTANDRDNDGSVAIGYKACYAQAGTGGAQFANSTIGIGYSALTSLSTGAGNVALGYEALKYVTIGDNNVALGHQALYSMNTADGNDNNVAIGTSALYTAGASSNVAAYNIAIGKDALKLNQTGDSNVCIGNLSGTALTAAGACIAIGNSALSAIATQDGTVAIGHTALAALTSGANNLAIGNAVMASITVGSNNIAVGAFALDAQVGDGSNASTAGHYNIAIGTAAMGDINTHSNSGSVLDKNIAIGTDALKGASFAGADINVESNIAIGHQAMDATLANAQTGTIAIGDSALGSLTSGARNTAIGYQSMLTTLGDSGGDNTMVGYNTGYRVGTASTYNTVLGSKAFSGNQTSNDSNYCVAIGYLALSGALDNITAGAIAIGGNALEGLTTGVNNTAIGYRAMKVNTIGNRNTTLGHGTMEDTDATFTDATCDYDDDQTVNCNANGSIAVGQSVVGTGIPVNNYITAITDGGGGVTSFELNAATTGGAVTDGTLTFSGSLASSDNVFIGFNAGNGTWTYNEVSDNVAIGSYAMDAALNGANGTVAIGKSSLSALTSGAKNTAIGSNSMLALEMGERNVAMGYQAMLAAEGDGYCVAIGYGALSTATYASATATYNTMVGYLAGDVIAAGKQNTCLGASADPGGNGATNQTAIGYGCTAVNTDNTVTLGNASVTQIHMSQDSDAVMYADGTINTSDERWKKNIEDSDLGLSFINSIRPVRYNFKSDEQNSKLKYGIVAQEVIEVLKAIDKEDFAGIETDDPDRLGADYIQFVAPLIKAVQELSAQVEELKNNK